MLALFAAGSRASGADTVAIQRSIDKAALWLQQNFNDIPISGEKSLATLALIKANVAPNSPAITSGVQGILAKCAGGTYVTSSNHIYEAGIDVNVLVELDPQQHLSQIQMIAEYLMAQQLPNGGWDYPTGREGLGDTSVTQYALLGLWAASRAGVTIPVSTWDKALDWHITRQGSDGGFAYVPGTNLGHENGASGLNMTVAATGSVLIAARHAFPAKADSLDQLLGTRRSAAPSGAVERRFGVLERVQLESPELPTTDAAAVAEPSGPSTANLEQVQQCARRAYAWVAGNFVPKKTEIYYMDYYYYTVERTAALANVEQIGRLNWYDACAESLLRDQKPEGQWDYLSRPWRATSFAILFLSRSTGKILRRTIPQDPLGGGLLQGGRGLPDDLSKPVAATGKKDLGPLDQLLAALENPGAINIDDVQQAIVEKVQVGDRKALVGQKDLLVKYIRHPEDEVRRMAAWALGRTDDLTLARYLVDALDDPNLDVMHEARNALCWLARKPRGLGETDGPFDGLPEDANDEQKKAAIAKWHSDLLRLWGPWYLDHRPYADRGDEFEAELREKIGSN